MQSVRSFILISILFIATQGVPVLCNAQPGGGGNPGSGGPVPITGIEILIGLGALIGVRKFYKNNRQK